MHCTIDRAALLTAVSAAVKLVPPKYSYSPNFERVLLTKEGDLLCLSATDSITHLDIYLPANFDGPNDHPIATKTKEFRYLLKEASGPAVLLHGSNEENEAFVYDLQEKSNFPNEHYLDWEPHDTVGSRLYASVRCDILARALEIADDFCATQDDNKFPGFYIRPLHDGLLFSATNAHFLETFQATTGVYRMDTSMDGHLVDRGCMQCLMAALQLWEGVDPESVDCEIRHVRKTKRHEDGDEWELDPILVFDISGAGVRVVVSTIIRREYCDIVKLLPARDRDGGLVRLRADELRAVCDDVVRQSKKKRGMIGFRFIVDRPAGSASVRMATAIRPPDRKDNSIVAPLVLPHHVSLQGNGPRIEQWNKEQQKYVEAFEDDMTVGVDACYLAAACKHLQGREAVLKFHGEMSEIEIMPADGQPDVIYFIGMPVRDSFKEEESVP